MVLTARAAVLLCGILAGSGGPTAGQQPTPAFTQFPAKVTPVPRAVAVRITRQQDRMFRRQLRRIAAQRPNFAGHYVLGTWGCGAGCVMAAAIDRATGMVTDLPFTVSDWPLAVTDPLTFKLDSSLLQVQGSRDEKGHGIYFYRFTGRDFVLVSATEAKEPAQPQ